MSMVQKIWLKLNKYPQFSILLSFVLLLVYFGVATDGFLSDRNVIGVLRQSVVPMCVAIGMTFILIAGGIDLSVGSVACLSGTVLASLMVKAGMSPALAILCSLLVGVLLGTINGIIIAYMNISSIIVTLAMMITARGLSLVYSGARPINEIPDVIIYLGRGYVLGIPIPVLFVALLLVAAGFVLVKTNFGRRIFALGGNEECARLSGINIERTKIAVFAISGLCAGIAGIILTMRLASSQPTMGEGLEMDAISAAVLGGTSIKGGKGYVVGTLIGCLFLAFLTNGFNVLNVSSFWQQVFKGIVLVLAVSLYERRKK